MTIIILLKENTWRMGDQELLFDLAHYLQWDKSPVLYNGTIYHSKDCPSRAFEKCYYNNGKSLYSVMTGE